MFLRKKNGRIWMRAQGLVYKNKHFSNILLVVVRPKPRPLGLFLAWKGLKQKRPKPQRSFYSYVRRSVLRLQGAFWVMISTLAHTLYVRAKKRPILASSLRLAWQRAFFWWILPLFSFFFFTSDFRFLLSWPLSSSLRYHRIIYSPKVNKYSLWTDII